ncbi:hypothetical protein PSI23_13815 [Xenorhabdus sp. XENO-10]|uniref:Repressor n=1 Tax=Xenorhabdus yunnanensis TaxID=3025878 RepID=A0ABT5LKG7_9GAMM|nr:hypothetical protein [Xenorhabdus yunnanensis]MDC9590339.1 hypothetical protein [Xenorhabdus yunnanensis]
MLDTIGKRLKCCRAATGKTTHDVVDHVHAKGEDISYATYTRWESGSSFPARKTHVIDHISDFFKENGLQVEPQWILTGEGFPPQLAEYTKLDEDTLFILASRTLPDVELVQVGGQYGEPYVNFGEFCIISNENNIESNNNKLCYVRHSEGVKIGVVIIMDEKQIIIPGKIDMILNKYNVIECRRVKWIQKK